MIIAIVIILPVIKLLMRLRSSLSGFEIMMIKMISLEIEIPASAAYDESDGGDDGGGSAADR